MFVNEARFKALESLLKCVLEDYKDHRTATRQRFKMLENYLEIQEEKSETKYVKHNSKVKGGK
jgi:hypothetical protein